MYAFSESASRSEFLATWANFVPSLYAAFRCTISEEQPLEVKTYNYMRSTRTGKHTIF